MAVERRVDSYEASMKSVSAFLDKEGTLSGSEKPFASADPGGEDIAIPLQILDQTCSENVLHSRLLCGFPRGACVLNAGRSLQVY